MPGGVGLLDQPGRPLLNAGRRFRQAPRQEAGIPNTFAYVMLAIWPLVCLMLFMRQPAPQALLWSVLAGYLLLPSATKFDLTGLPDLDKSSMIAIGAGLGTLIFGKRPAKLGGGRLFYGLGAVFVLSPFVTASYNPDPIVGKTLFFPGMTMYDGLSLAGSNSLALVPFWAGRRLLASEQAHRLTVRSVALAMLAYSVLVLFEVRFSPQLHVWTYGIFPHDFSQQFRNGGFRAVVFLSHGLIVALFLALGLVAALAQARSRAHWLGVPFIVWALYLSAVMVLQKSLGAAILAAGFGAVLLALSPRRHLAVAAMVAMVVVAYPMVRGAHLLPFERIQAIATSFSADRAGSLNTRLVNEEELLKKANERPMFGWGGWGRNRYVDLESGRNRSLTDGTWIIVMGSAGWVGYIAMFGLLSFPLVRLWRRCRKPDVPDPYTAALALMLALNLCDLIPNSSLTPLTWLMAGALAGHLVQRKSVRKAADGPAEPARSDRTFGGAATADRSGASPVGELQR